MSGVDPRSLKLPLPFVLCLVLGVLAVLTVSERFNDPDMWWHLRTGQIIWQRHRIPVADVFSYTTANHPTIPHEWLSQLTIYIAYLVAGYSGMMLWLAAASAALLILTFWVCYRRTGDPRIAFAGAMIVWICSTVALAVRPQMLGYCFLAVELLLFELRGKWLLLLPPLFLLWVNCHGSFFFGFGIAVLYLLRWRALRVLLLSAASLFVTPVGWKQTLYPLDTLFHQSASMRLVTEWRPLAIHDPRAITICIVLAVVAWGLITHRVRLHVTELAVIAAASWLAFSHARLAIVFGLVAAPAFCCVLATLTTKPQPRSLSAAFAIGCAVLMVLAFPDRNRIERQIDAGNPTQAVAFLRQHPPAGRLVNEYVYGGYLIWALPEQKVFIDGRGDIFDWTGVLREYDDWRSLRRDTRGLLTKYNAGACLLLRDSPVAKRLASLPGWKTAVTDGSAVLFYHE